MATLCFFVLRVRRGVVGAARVVEAVEGFGSGYWVTQSFMSVEKHTWYKRLDQRRSRRFAAPAHLPFFPLQNLCLALASRVSYSAINPYKQNMHRS